MNIVSARASRLALSLLVAALLPAACSSSAHDPSPESVSSAPQAIVSVSHQWLFNESSGSTTADAVSGGVTGTLGSSASLAGGSVNLTAGSAYDPDSYVDFGTSAAAFGTNDFTVAHWYKTTFGGGGILGDVLGNRVDGSHGRFLSIRLNGSGYVTMEVDEDGGGTNYAATGTSTTVNDGAWHHLAYVREGANIKIYVDGSLSGSANAGSGQPANVADGGTASFRVGRRLPDCCGNFLTIPASYGDLRIYDSALDAGDVAGIVSSSATCTTFGTYNCGGQAFNGCTGAVPCGTGDHCTSGAGCASGVCTDGTCQHVESWVCSDHCYGIAGACYDVKADIMDACIDACGNDTPCLQGCYDAYFAGIDQCDGAVPACIGVCD